MSAPLKPPAERGKLLVEARDLIKVYGNGASATHALDGVSLEIRSGELLVILGSSGSGKSTLLNIIGGMDQPTSGHVLFQNQMITGMGDKKLTRYRKQHISFIFQNFNLIPELTALENVDLTADKSEDPQIAMRMLALVDLADRADAYPSQMSGGQQQRVSIARALAKRSELMLCDEPTGALDSETGSQILIQLEDLARVYGHTVVIVTHTREISRMADRTVVIRNGKMIREEINREIVSAREITW